MHIEKIRQKNNFDIIVNGILKLFIKIRITVKIGVAISIKRRGPIMEKEPLNKMNDIIKLLFINL